MKRIEMPIAWRALAERAVAEYRAALGGDLLAVACFGSVARGEPDPESDLDLYIVTREQVSTLLDRRLAGTVRLRDTPEYQALARQWRFRAVRRTGSRGSARSCPAIWRWARVPGCES